MTEFFGSTNFFSYNKMIHTFKGKGDVNLTERINKFTLERATVEDIFNINGYIKVITD